MTGKENFAKLLAETMKQGQAQDTEATMHELAHFIRVMYQSFIDEGFSGAESMEMCNLAIMQIFGNIK